MIPLILGKDVTTGRKIQLKADLFQTHFHLIGATGTGKTTAIHTMLRPILMNPRRKACLFLVDPMGGLSRDLLLWMADKRRCPEHVRRRLLYIEPAAEDYVLPFNPLMYESEANEYYQVERAVDIILRAWDSQDIDQMPRLRKWTFAAFFAAARLGFPIAACRYLLSPGTDEHNALIQRLPPGLQSEWSEIYRTRSSEAIRILESTRNRLSPFFDSVILRRMFGSCQSRFDVERFIKERRIVILNVSKGLNKLSGHLGRTIGALAVNEVLDKVHTLSLREGRGVIEPTYLLLDEFQHFVGPDLADALPLVRQMGLRLILAHQSFSQLLKGDLDLSTIIWQARSRLMFANDADDADLIAHELATLTFDPMRIKHQIFNYSQRIAGYRREWLESNATGQTTADNWSRQSGHSTQSADAYAHPLHQPHEASVRNTRGSGHSTGDSSGGSTGQSQTSGRHEQLVPIHEDREQLSGVTFQTFEEFKTVWAAQIRKLGTGLAFGKFRNDPDVHHILIDYHPVHETARIRDAVKELKAKNFEDQVFVSAAQIDCEAETARQLLLSGPAQTIDIAGFDTAQKPKEESHGEPFRS